MFDLSRSEIPIPILFYFEAITELRSFENFTVEQMESTSPHREAMTIWCVRARIRFTKCHETVAEFETELYANIFRDMAEIVAAHV